VTLLPIHPTETSRENLAMRHYVRSLRALARRDKDKAVTAADDWWRDYHRASRRHRLREAWHWRGLERTLRRIREERPLAEAAE
jgi:hypothetical protein